jgi:hypothetical protein
MEAEVLAAIIGGGAGLLGALIAFWAARLTAKTELVFTRKQLEAETRRAESEIRAQLRATEADIYTRFKELEQSQLTELVKKRLEAYPQLYEIIARYGRNWQLLGKAFDLAWASQFLNELVECNARIGVYFSDDVYIAYGQLRDRVTMIRDRISDGNEASEEEIEDVLAIIRNKYWGEGLGTYMKDDCGTFRFGSLVARSQADEDRLRNRLEALQRTPADDG